MLKVVEVKTAIFINTKEDVEKIVKPPIHDATLFINGELLSCQLPNLKYKIELLRLLSVWRKLNLDIYILKAPGLVLDSSANHMIVLDEVINIRTR